MEIAHVLTIVAITITVVLLIYRVKEGQWPGARSRDDGPGPDGTQGGGNSRPGTGKL